MSKEYYRREVHRRKRLSLSWRRPKGLHSKVRRKEKYVKPMPSARRRSPRKERGLLPGGIREVLIHNVEELRKVGKGFAARIASGVGKRKRLMILEEAKKLKIKVLNP